MLRHPFVSAANRARPWNGRRHADARGQSLVEFALVLPMLLVLLLGLADFGRVFSAGITVEAAARNAAEAAAQEYVQLARNRPGGGLVAPDDYDHLHDVAIAKVCQETVTLPNANTAGSLCTMPAVAVCVHDGSGDLATAGCGGGTAAAPSECTGLSGWQPLLQGASPLGASPLPYVEVRVCYRFTTLINLSNLRLPFGWGLSLGDIYLQKDRNFTVACYADDTSGCV